MPVSVRVRPALASPCLSRGLGIDCGCQSQTELHEPAPASSVCLFNAGGSPASGQGRCNPRRDVSDGWVCWVAQQAVEERASVDSRAYCSRTLGFTTSESPRWTRLLNGSQRFAGGRVASRMRQLWRECTCDLYTYTR
jgi:hypothetical protein